MALTVTQIERRTVFGDRRVNIFEVTFDSSYATGGESLTAADLALSRVDFVDSHAAAAAAGTASVQVKYDYTNSKLQAFGADGAAAGIATLKEIPAATDLSTFVCRVMAVGV